MDDDETVQQQYLVLIKFHTYSNYESYTKNAKLCFVPINK